MMKRLLICAAAALAVLSCDALASMTVKLNDGGPYGGGGAFYAYALTDDATGDTWADYGVDKSQDFWTFCLERDIHMRRNTQYAVTIGNVVEAANRTLSDGAKKLYAAWLDGDSVLYNDHELSLANEGAVQAAIWKNEGFTGSSYGNSADLYAWSQDIASTPYNWEHVSVMNLWTIPGGSDVQSQLVMTAVPAPGAIMLGSIGIAFVGWLRRRNAL